MITRLFSFLLLSVCCFFYSQETTQFVPNYGISENLDLLKNFTSDERWINRIDPPEVDLDNLGKKLFSTNCIATKRYGNYDNWMDFSYNDKGWITKIFEKQINFSRDFSYKTDSNGKIVEIIETEKNALGKINQKTSEYKYDDLGRVIYKESNSIKSFATYDDKDRPTSITYKGSNGTAVFNYTYDDNGFLKTIENINEDNKYKSTVQLTYKHRDSLGFQISECFYAENVNKVENGKKVNLDLPVKKFRKVFNKDKRLIEFHSYSSGQSDYLTYHPNGKIKYQISKSKGRSDNYNDFLFDDKGRLTIRSYYMDFKKGKNKELQSRTTYNYTNGQVIEHNPYVEGKERNKITAYFTCD